MVRVTVKNAMISVIFISCSTTNKLEGYLDVSFVIYLMVCVCVCVCSCECGHKGVHTCVYMWRPGIDGQGGISFLDHSSSVCMF